MAKIDQVALEAALEVGRLTYLQDPEAGRKRYEAALREFNQEVDAEVERLRIARAALAQRGK